MIISQIAAVDKHFGLGGKNQLLWHLPKDFKHFKEVTSGKPVLMGRKTYESLPEKFRPLPGRTNIIITRKHDFKAENCHVFSDIQSALQFAKTLNQEELFVIGGAEIYKQMLEFTHKIYLTLVDHAFEGMDAFFPKLGTEWKETSRRHFDADEKNQFDFDIVVFEKQ